MLASIFINLLYEVSIPIIEFNINNITVRISVSI